MARMGMKWRLAMLALAGALLSGGALAHHVSWHVGIGFGYPGYGYGYGARYGYGYYGGPWGYSYPYPAPYAYPYYSQPSEPPDYVERSEAAASTDNNWWHYCPESKMFYPYVKECPAGWQRVSPTPPDVKERNR